MVGGLRVIIDQYCYKTERKQVRFPRSKRVRIRRKWAKLEHNWKVSSIPQAYQMGDMLIAHPAVVDQLRKLAKKD